MKDRLFERETFAKPLNPLQYTRPLVLAPHPDDEVYGCGGLLATWAAHGVQADVVLVTSGSQQGASAEGSAAGPAGAPLSLSAAREAESRAAAALLGYRTSMWGLADRGLRCDEELIGRIEEALAGGSFDVVLSPALTETHPDHQAVTLALMCALCRRSGTVMPDVLLYESGGTLTQPTSLLDISSVQALKEQAMACFGSQEGVQPYRSRIAARDHFRALQLGPDCRAAEAFTLLAVSRQGWPAVVSSLEPLFLHARGQASAPDDLPLVSVMIRSSGDAHLERTLACVAAQTYPRLEVVVVGADGSTGEGRSLAQRPGVPLRWVGTGQRMNRPQAANAALDAAQGQWLIFLDDDDLWTPEHVERLLGVQRANGQVLAVHSDVTVINAEGTEISRYDQGWSRERMAFTNTLPIHSVLFDAALVRTKGCRFDEGLDALEDWDFWLQVTQHTPVVHAKGFTALYRYSDRSGQDSLARGRSLAHWRGIVQERWLQRMDVQSRLKAIAWYAGALDQAEQVARAQAVRADGLEKKRSALEDRLRDLQQEHEAARVRLAQAVHEATLAREQHRAVELDVAALRERIQSRDRELTQHLAQHQEVMAMLTAERDRDRQAHVALQGLADEQAATLQAMRGSTSWRVTAPLRWVGRLLRGKRP